MDNDVIENQVKTYYPSGSIATYQEYDDGYLNGISILYYESGKIARKLKYRLLMATRDNTYKEHVSLIDGTYYEFEEDSTMKTCVIYKRGCIEEIKHWCESSYIIPSTDYIICM
jgi:antitoxin component YwqK of YwqJK toxin-antitoxin module